jgi:methionyl-tRNA formyltransferase
MLRAPLLAVAAHGALNMHGSLLPRYRGRAPVNWAVLHGEREAGATLHYMTEKPDYGDIVASTAVPILPDDTAQEVFDKVTVAAEMTLDRVLPSLISGAAPRIPQNHKAGGYFGARTAEDGAIDWTRDAATIHNLVRAVAPPYPGALTTIGGAAARILRTRVVNEAPTSMPAIVADGDRLLAHCGGGGVLQVLSLEIEGAPVTAAGFVQRFGTEPIRLGGSLP